MEKSFAVRSGNLLLIFLNSDNFTNNHPVIYTIHVNNIS